MGLFNHQPVTLPKTNMEPENDGFQEESPFPGVYFQVLLLMDEILHQLIGSLSHYLQGLIHPRWCRISSIKSMFKFEGVWFPKASIFKGNNRYLKTIQCFFTKLWAKKPFKNPYSYHPCMVYSPTWMVHLYGKCGDINIYIFTICIDAMG